MAVGTPVALGYADNTATSTTVVLTTTGASVAGDSIIVVLFNGSSTPTFSSLTDSVGNTYATDFTQSGAGAGAGSLWILSCHNASVLGVGATMTATWSSAQTQNRGIYAFAVSGLANTPKDKAVGQAVANNANWNSTSSGTLSQADELAVGALYSSSGSSSTVGGGFTELRDGQTVDLNHFVVQYLITAATTAVTASGTTGSGASDWSAALVTYKASAGGTTDTAGVGVASASGISPIGRAAAPAGFMATASGVAPATAAQTSTGTAIAAGVAPAASVVATAPLGMAQATGVSPQATLAKAASPGLATAAGITPSSSATATPTPGVASVVGVSPLDGQSQTPTPGFAVAGGVMPESSASDTPILAAAVGSGTSPASRVRTDQGVAVGQGIPPSPAVAVSMAVAIAAGFAPEVGTYMVPGVSLGAGVSPDASTVVVVTPGAAVGSGIEPTITRPAVRYSLTPGTRRAGNSLTPGTRPSLSLSASERPRRTLEVS